MSTFDDREKGYEGKFAHDQELEFKAIARRDRLIGLWAAEKMGLEATTAGDYARAIIPLRLRARRSRRRDPQAGAGPQSPARVEVRESEVRQKMDELLAQAREALKSEG